MDSTTVHDNEGRLSSSGKLKATEWRAMMAHELLRQAAQILGAGWSKIADARNDTGRIFRYTLAPAGDRRWLAGRSGPRVGPATTGR